MRPTPQAPRRKRVKGQWMRLRDSQLLAAYMDNADFTQSRLARYAECSRQFVHMLLTGKRRTCTEKIAARIEEALRVLPGTLFADEKSPTSATAVARKKTAA